MERGFRDPPIFFGSQPTPYLVQIQILHQFQDSMVELYIYLNGQGYWVNDLNGWTQRAKNIVNQRANIATGEKYCEWAAKHIKIFCLPRE